MYTKINPNQGKHTRNKVLGEDWLRCIGQCKNYAPLCVDLNLEL